MFIYTKFQLHAPDPYRRRPQVKRARRRSVERTATRYPDPDGPAAA